MNLTHEIPSEFQNEERWLNFFTLESLVVCLAVGGVGVILAKLTSLLFGSMLPGGIIGVFLVVIAYVVTMKHIPEGDYIKGGGMPVKSYLINRYVRMSNLKIYILGYGDEEVNKYGND